MSESSSSGLSWSAMGSVAAIFALLLGVFYQNGQVLDRLTKLEAKVSVGVSARLDAVEKRMSSFETRSLSLENRMGDLEERMGSLDRKVSALDDKVDSLEDKVDSLEDKMEEGFAAIERKLDDRISVVDRSGVSSSSSVGE